MFGPNCIPEYHQHEPRFFQLMENLSNTFRKTFHVSDEFDILFVPGCGSLVMEMIIWSLKDTAITIPVEQQSETFGQRLMQQCLSHNKTVTEDSDVLFGVHYETSISRKNEVPQKRKESDLLLLDCVSSFPYYPTPPEVDVWATVSGKQLSSTPGLGIIVFRRSVAERFKPAQDDPYINYSVLNVNRARMRMEEWKPPHTPAFSLLSDLWRTMTRRSYANRYIDNKRALIAAAVGADALSGTGPVVTFKDGVIPKSVADEFCIFPRPHHQVFLWSCEDYNKFHNFLNKIRR
jgi:aspartate aminotransferase-like enzyme